MTDAVPSTAMLSSDGDVRVLRAAAAHALASRFPVRWLEEHAVLPLSVANGEAIVAADGELPGLVADALARALSARIAVRRYAAADIRAALVATPRVSGAARVDPLQGEVVESLDDLRALASREPVVQVVNALLGEAVRSNASDVHFESTSDGLRVRMRRDGVLHDVQHLGKSFQAGVLSRLKVVAGLDIAERRLPQDGRARVNVDGRDIDVRVSTLPAIHGESLVLRLLDSGVTGSRSLTDLGIGDAVQAAWTQLIERTSGLVLVTGPTGSGKTTTLYAALTARSTPGVKVVTVEDPVEYRLDGIVQLPVNSRAGFGFPNALRAILRHDPDVILVGEMRDAETAEIAVQAALTGHLVLSTLHTTDATGALARLTEMGVPAYLLAATLQGVLAQRLVRLVCDVCGEWRTPTAGEIALAYNANGKSGPPLAHVREGPGCTHCGGTGYKGRAAIAELLVIDDALRAAFVAGQSQDELRALARSHGVASLLHDGWRLIHDGRTTVAEVTRVVSEDENP